MGTRVGTACSSNVLSTSLRRLVVARAMESGNIERPDIVFAFCTNNVDPIYFFDDIKKVVGEDVPIVGGSAIGTISNDFLCYSNSTVGVMILQSETIRFRLRSAGGLDKDETETGERLIKDILQEQEAKDGLFMVMYDSIKMPPGPNSPPVMNSSSYLLAGIEKGLERPIPIVGAGLVGDYNMGPTFQFCGSSVGTEQAVGLMLNGDFASHYQIMHGCTPLDGIYHQITNIKGPVLYELDGRPIVEVINEMLGDEEWQKERPVDFLTIGVHYGERFGEYREGEYVNRLITGVTPDKKGVMLFEPDLEDGMEIQFMVRDPERMIESARRNTNLLLKSLTEKGSRPLFGIYVDCAGRAGNYLNTGIEEAAEVQSLFNYYNIPLFGFYTGVEIAPLIGKSRGLDWTGVLLVLTEEDRIVIPAGG
ncbi:MAG: FIST N domain protein [Syntrophorhabdus sp. PtaU1.Bin050]|nr:MAG: FIST N domain protein [Syntrophorhabdus sp. PtaU1.Bin050]